MTNISKTSMPTFFITGIGTDVGKTIASAILVKALGADYWKPVQCGDLDNSDSMKVQRLTGCAVHQEAYRLRLPMSPHAAAEAEGVEISLDRFQIPDTAKPLIVEGAGGLLVPLNGRQTVLDLILHLNIPVIALSQLNRSVETRAGGKPMLADLRESGAIEQDADVVLFIHRNKDGDAPPEELGRASVIIAKQRNGEVGEVDLSWIAEYARFENLETRMPMESLPPPEEDVRF